MLVSYNWLKDYLGKDTPAPDVLAEQLTFHAFEIDGIEELEHDTVLDVSVLPDRSSDCLSHRGIAHEIAAILDQPLAHDPLSTTPELPQTNAIDVVIEDSESCPRFTASIIEGIKVKESPKWLQDRLRALGQRPINNIVDATNYVMYALGQPLHAYDADKFPQVDGQWQFVVRPAKAGETVALLAEGGKDEERDLTLNDGELLIVDGSSDTPIGLAGVKGGRFAGVDSNTTRIIVEAAHFHPIRTRTTARRHKIVIDASKRFENEPSRVLPPYAQADIITLITEIAGGACAGFVDEYLIPVMPPTVTVRPARVNALLGLKLEVATMVALLERLGVTVDASDQTALQCTGPSERTDLTIEESFIEEVGRLYGYEHVQSIVPDTVPLAEFNARQYYGDKIRHLLVGQGFSEVITSSFRKKDQIKLLNALASDKGCLRSSLMKNMTETLDKNVGFQDLLGQTETRVFEIGTVFTAGAGTINEHVSLCIGIRLKQSGYSQKEDPILAEVLTKLESLLGVKVSATIEKGVAEIDLSAILEKLPAPTAYDAVPPLPEVVYRPFSIYPSVSRDIAMWVPEGMEPATVTATLNEAAGPLWVRTTHIDSFTKDGRTSLAFRLVFQSMDKTLTDAEVNTYMDRVYAAATKQGWETR